MSHVCLAASLPDPSNLEAPIREGFSMFIMLNGTSIPPQPLSHTTSPRAMDTE